MHTYYAHTALLEQFVLWLCVFVNTSELGIGLVQAMPERTVVFHDKVLEIC